MRSILIKSTFVFITIFASGKFSNAQTTNTFPADGSVGIGTTNPRSNLEVIGTIRWGETDTNYIYSGQDGMGAYIEQSGSNISKSKIRFQSSKNGNGTDYCQFIMDPEKGFSFLNMGYGNNDVGIGTSDTKGYKLAVNGKIRAQEIKIENSNWPDFVFTKSYQLPTLQEIGKHIKEKGHLPGIPSAEEVKANGIHLGEMNAKLLQKIEELTLHLIEQNKLAISQKEELASQRLLLQKMQHEMDLLKGIKKDK